MRVPVCHQGRPEITCPTCYQREWKRRARAKHRVQRFCRLCGNGFSQRRRDALCCSAECGDAYQSLSRTADRLEELFAVRSREAAVEIVRLYRSRGCRIVGGRAAGRCTDGYWVSCRRRGTLWIIRARLPEEYSKEEAA